MSAVALPLFRMEDEQDSGGRLKIARTDTIRVETVAGISDLFDGFRTMKAITWSYGVGMVVRQMRKFEEVELVFGCKAMLEKQVRLSALAPLMVQAEMIKSLQNKWGREISERVEDGSCRLFFENTISSHQKIYLLADEEAGKFRIITGSANFSMKAFCGDKQKEIILVCDDKDSYYEFLEKMYLPFKETCTNQVKNLKAKLDAIDEKGIVGLDEIPILDNNSGIVIFEQAENDESDVIVSMNDCALLGGISTPQMNKLSRAFKSSKNQFLIDRQSLSHLKLEGQKIEEENEAKIKECPKLAIDYSMATVSMNGNLISTEGWKDDIRRIVDFIDNFNAFSGDTDLYQADAWKIIVWYFATPFFSMLRKASISAQQEGLLISLPMFLFLFGGSNAGKTSLMVFLGKAMCGERIEPLPGNNFRSGDPVKNTKSNTIRKPRLMQVNQMGLPVLYDDVGRGQMAEGALRNLLTTPYSKTLDEKYAGYPAVIATSNITPLMPQEFQKRALFFQSSASLNQKQAIENGHIPNRLTEEISAAFFAEYVRRIAPELLDAAKPDEIAELDVYEISSRAILNIMQEADCRPN